MSGLIRPASIIYRFEPSGSRNLLDFTMLKCNDPTWTGWMQSVLVVMHDQEPLNFDLYSPGHIEQNLKAWLQQNSPGSERYLDSVEVRKHWCSLNLNFVRRFNTLYDHSILIHSEQRSLEVEKYTTVDFEPVYWWSHGIIARDWYRYAEIDHRLKFSDQFVFDFNVYNRAWSGTREYRLKFADLLIQHDLVKSSQVTFNPWDQGQHYHDHQFQNPQFRPCADLEQLPTNQATSNHSADYDPHDYAQCAIDVVLETLFDDGRLHLTEKILRPIACGKPFILAATMGSLGYLRSYGFETFGDIIDESYDLESDPLTRLHMIVSSMKKFNQLDPVSRQEKITQLHARAAKNKERFFSTEFFSHLTKEFIDNYNTAQRRCDQNRLGRNWLAFRDLALETASLEPLVNMVGHPAQDQLHHLLRSITPSQVSSSS